MRPCRADTAQCVRGDSCCTAPHLGYCSRACRMTLSKGHCHAASLTLLCLTQIKPYHPQHKCGMLAPRVTGPCAARRPGRRACTCGAWSQRRRRARCSGAATSCCPSTAPTSPTTAPCPSARASASPSATSCPGSTWASRRAPAFWLCSFPASACIVFCCLVCRKCAGEHARPHGQPAFADQLSQEWQEGKRRASLAAEHRPHHEQGN